MAPPTRISKQRLAGVAGTPGTPATLSLLATGTQVTPWMPVRGRRMSVVVAWSGTPTGTFSLECSDGTTLTRVVPGAAAEFTANGNAQPAGSASGAVWNWVNVPGAETRISYAATSGTGTFSYQVIWAE